MFNLFTLPTSHHEIWKMIACLRNLSAQWKTFFIPLSPLNTQIISESEK